MQDIQTRDQAHYETMSAVVELFVTGNKNATAIAKTLGLPRRDVLDYIDEWREIAKSNEHIKDRAAQAINDMDLHYDKIIREMWTIIEADLTDTRTKATTLKAVSEVEAKRQEVLQKAGIYDDSGIADQMVLMEEKVDKMQQLLINVTSMFPDTKMYIIERLSMVQDAPVPVPSETTMQGEVVTD